MRLRVGTEAGPKTGGQAIAEAQGKLASEQEARDVAEGAREQEWENISFAGALFSGDFDLGPLWPPPQADSSEDARAEEWLARVEAFARDHIDGDAIDRDCWVPDEVLQGLAELGCYGIKIPREYGGLGFSQTTYGKARAPSRPTTRPGLISPGTARASAPAPGANAFLGSIGISTSRIQLPTACLIRPTR